MRESGLAEWFWPRWLRAGILIAKGLIMRIPLGILVGAALVSGVVSAAPAADPSKLFDGRETDARPSFRRHVVPLMSRMGCSGRECHGSFQGRGGFQLSLFGYDFDKDHKAIVKDDNGDEGEVRVNLELPEKSLVLTKGAAIVSHKGKERFKKGSWEYRMLLKWIKDGAGIDVAETGEFDRLEVLPKDIAFRRPGEKVALKVFAYWKDGTVEEVTRFTRFRSNDDSVVTIDEQGVAECKGKGDSHVVAFYDNGVTPVPVLLPVSDRTGDRFPKLAARTQVDRFINDKLKAVGIVPAESCTDAEFLRRASLDVTGTLPTPAEVEAFLADKSVDKRDRKVDELLSRPGYAAWWATLLSDFTGNNPRLVNNGIADGLQNAGGKVSRLWYDWLERKIRDNVPYDQIAAGLVMARTRTSPDQSYEAMARELSSYFAKENSADFGARKDMPWYWFRSNLQKAEDKALAFAHTFLGVRIECAQCHKHPFDQWTKQDFEQFQAFFTAVGAKAEAKSAKAGGDPSAMTAARLRNEINREVKDRLEAEERRRAEEAAEKARAAAEKAAADAGAAAVAKGTDAACAKPAGADGAGATAPAVVADPEKGEKEKAKELAVKADKLRRLTEVEMSKRLDGGQPIPWRDLSAEVKASATSKTSKPVKAVAGSSRVITPKLLGGDEVVLSEFPDARQPLMEWLRSKENPYFAKAWVNRVWANYFGRGIVEPADDLNLANAPSNGPLFDHLAKGFVESGYDIKWLHREILRSDAYQRSWKTNATNKLDEKNFSHALVRRLPAEVVHDAIAMASDSDAAISEYPVRVGERAIGPAGGGAQMAPGKTKGLVPVKSVDGYALGIFGKPQRTTNCDCERVTDPTLLQTIYTRNDPSILQRLSEKGGRAWIEKALGGEAPRKGVVVAVESDAEKAARIDGVVRQIFLRTVSRPPTEEEMGKARSDIAAAPSAVSGCAELLWVMLNTREFLVNH